MLTLVDKALLVKFYYLSQESVPEALRRFRTEKKMKSTDPITPEGLTSLIRLFKETVSLQDRPCNGAPRLSEVRTSSVVLLMNTLREQSMSSVQMPVCSGQEVA
ncbi:hypothetical protein TNIN_151851 [Trichonephila inaurata madagascariensis]|uniref:DUF4817 domain-containing protein n=1 Tax=Trichonephila inaurata madagascariensis TaxID=2747483 RepID=A0A8X7C5G8_9ARAC|nr:hypothetical protein TNIN_151851 [Trichonephila inaurata madagascariensis]